MPPFHLVDAFTDTPFAGNSAGVVVTDGAVDTFWAQQVAAEVGASETAFVHPSAEGWALRWWTPVVEVDLCGHATLATAHVLWASGAADPSGTLRFSTRSGVLTARREGAEIVLDLPAWPVQPHPEPPALARVLAGTAGRYVGRTGGATGDVGGDQANDVVDLPSERDVAAFAPDRDAVIELGSAGLIVTAPADEAHGDDLVSRYFAPAVGIDEDPVTGSAHCTLAPLWAQRLGRTTLTARQLSPRGGWLRLAVRDDRVDVAGHATTVIRGELTSPAPAEDVSAVS